MRLGRLVLGFVALVVGLPAAVVGPAQATAGIGGHLSRADRLAARMPMGSDPFVAGAGYRGDFPDPSVLLWDGTYYAYGTRTAGLNLPVLTSTDLATWTVPSPDPTTSSTDALPDVASWADWRMRAGHRVALTWAPSVAYLEGRFVATYATPVAGSTGPVGGRKMCISVAVADSPSGPFVDDSTSPLKCPADRGAIDPQIYTEDGHVYLLYKTEDISIGRLTRIWIRELTPDGMHLLPGGAPHLLLRAHTYPSWEGRVVENPGLIMVAGRRYLLYSGGSWAGTGYAEGYAVCASLTAPCRRPTVPKVFWVRNKVQPRHKHRKHRHYRVRRHRVVRQVPAPPLLATGGAVAGPGGGMPFLDAQGTLRLAYHAWDAGRVGYPAEPSCQTTADGCAQRRLHIATLATTAAGGLAVAARDAVPAR
ncbi:MAG: glycoside hydrolase family 43 protein [Marmoricola sp.]